MHGGLLSMGWEAHMGMELESLPLFWPGGGALVHLILQCDPLLNSGGKLSLLVLKTVRSNKQLF